MTNVNGVINFTYRYVGDTAGGWEKTVYLSASMRWSLLWSRIYNTDWMV